MQKYQLRQADIAKVRERLKKQLPTDLALKASQIEGTGVKCSICAPTDWGKRLHRALQCQNCETHEQGSCHMMVAKELFPNSDFVRRIAEVFWFRLISSLYPRRPRWGKTEVEGRSSAGDASQVEGGKSHQRLGRVRRGVAPHGNPAADQTYTQSRWKLCWHDANRANRTTSELLHFEHI